MKRQRRRGCGGERRRLRRGGRDVFKSADGDDGREFAGRGGAVERAVYFRHPRSSVSRRKKIPMASVAFDIAIYKSACGYKHQKLSFAHVAGNLIIKSGSTGPTRGMPAPIGAWRERTPPLYAAAVCLSHRSQMFRF
ncbi:MAG: hypothetical protein LBU32_13815 [Clostridiales bacterium]|nr:hypothetical protein [Clostridiales bacterium]